MAKLNIFDLGGCINFNFRPILGEKAINIGFLIVSVLPTNKAKTLSQRSNAKAMSNINTCSSIPISFLVSSSASAIFQFQFSSLNSISNNTKQPSPSVQCNPWWVSILQRDPSRLR
ncbi:hypothetical protein VNO77_12957 [Canavalia gladiata]|uniref:Uncharacterized protein n=1 Tax=Canavalia gladiata TaxID=3824 RepID=A0AAN9LWU6_CANGL